MTYQLQNAIPYMTGLPEDVITNVFHFNWLGGGTPDATAFGVMCDNVSNFYETIFPAAGTNSMAPWTLPNQCRQRVYDLDAPIPRVPIFSRTDSLVVKKATTSTTTPETALVLSYQAAPASGLNQARRRGRVYIGGIGDGLQAGTTAQFPLPTVAMLNAMRDAALALRDAVTITNWQWVVYSRAGDSTSVVRGGWTDNALDTQRRRGQVATTRTLWGSTTPP